MASFSSDSFSTDSFSTLSFFFDAVEQLTAGGKKKRKKYLELPNGKVVEVTSLRQAQRILNAYYDANDEEVHPLKKKRVILRSDTHSETTADYFSVKPVSKAITLPQYIFTPVDMDAIIRHRLLIKQYRDEEELLLTLLLA